MSNYNFTLSIMSQSVRRNISTLKSKKKKIENEFFNPLFNDQMLKFDHDHNNYLVEKDRNIPLKIFRPKL
jgi:hypothetical protein